MSNDIILVFKYPIVFPTNYILYILSLAPNRDSKILIPAYPYYVAIHEKDLLYIETECPKYSHGHLCEDNLSRHYGEQSESIQQPILQQQVHESCRFTSVILSSEAMEQLDDRHYVLSFPNLTKVRLTCSQDQYEMLQGSYLAVTPKGCALHTPVFTTNNYHDQVEGQILKIFNIAISQEDPYKVPVKKTLKLNTIDLSHLHSTNSRITLQEPVTLESTNIETIYHTTIPVYGLLGASALVIIAVLIRRKLLQRISYNTNSQNEIKEETQNSQEVKDSSSSDPASLSALFSTKVFK